MSSSIKAANNDLNHTDMVEELEKREESYRDLVENSPDAVIIACGDDILFINETGASLFGAINKEEIQQKKVVDLIHADYHEGIKERVEMVTSGNATDFFEYKLIRLDGSVFEAEVKGIPTIFQNQAARHIIIRDITDRKKTLALLLNAEKLNMAGQLAAGIAHEVRNPLTAIKGFLQLMETKLNEHKSYFDIIQSEINRIELILSELLVLAKPQDLKFAPVRLQTMIEDVKTLIDTQAIMNNVEITFMNECGNLIINCDQNQLKQVVINFLKNAIEAMPRGGEVTIELKKHGFNQVKMLFKDNGCGMPRHVLQRIGEPFFTTKESGTGLGIMNSKQIIENHHGTVHFWSDKKGTIIEVILPINGHIIEKSKQKRSSLAKNGQ
ncbi:ATP-binding protein [Neobacillus sp. OS1-33]|uniref:ATP-binding protein n=1 Tax=Neobacillus sp. OS1-33 TaxID=3070683 RepID=UPI0027DFBD26|nr:ATP-binding protein [Neobacillus sp. OS1-33]WML25393.1 ATP-binding protein [Neobacillus sp. OS1-33]